MKHILYQRYQGIDGDLYYISINKQKVVVFDDLPLWGPSFIAMIWKHAASNRLRNIPNGSPKETVAVFIHGN